MDRETALEILELDGEPLTAEIREAFRLRAKVLHPDSGNESMSGRWSMDELRSARDLLLADGESPESEAGTALATLETVDRALALQTKAINSLAYSRDADRVARKAVSRQIGRMDGLKRRQIRLAAISGVIAVASYVVGSELASLAGGFEPIGIVLRLYGLASVVLTAILLYGAWSVNSQVNIQAQLMTEATEALSDAELFYSTFHELLASRGREVSRADGFAESFTRDALQQVVESWINEHGGIKSDHSSRIRISAPIVTISGFGLDTNVGSRETMIELAARVGPIDFTNVLIARGLENGYLTRSALADSSSRLPSFRYTLSI